MMDRVTVRFLLPYEDMIAVGRTGRRATSAHDSPRHREKLLEQPLPPRLGSLITHELFECATAAAARFGSPDVVVILDLSSPNPAQIAERRVLMAGSPQFSDGLLIDYGAVNASILCAGATA